MASTRGAETRGVGDISSPIIWLYPPNILNGFTSERKFGEKRALFLMKTFTFFFWSSPEFGKKKFGKKLKIIFDEDLFFLFVLHLNSGRKSVPFAFFSLAFTKFPHLGKIVVEVHPPQC